MPKSTHSLVLATIAVLVSVAPHVSANCAMPASYTVDVAGSTVTIASNSFGDRACPDGSGMLRENVATGEVVKLADFCSTATEDGSRTAGYIDECVPRGSYRYGFASPYKCYESSCGTYYFEEAEVTVELADGCARSEGNAAPTKVSKAPWGSDNVICSYGGDSGEGGDSGCSIAAGSGSTTVFVVNFAAVLLGLALRRKRGGSLGR
jgi:hypothetical protein